MPKKFLYLFVLIWGIFTAPVASFAAEKESAFDRVMRTQTIRCGYGTADPWIMKDVETGAMTGFYVEIMEEVAKSLSLKLEWPEETGWANIPTSLATGRVDVACSTLWVDPMRGRQVAHTRPLFYSPLYVYTRASDKKFNKNTDLNKLDVKIVVQDGDISAALAKRHYPKATLVSLPSTASVAEFYENVVTGKADIVFSDGTTTGKYNEGRPEDKKLRRIPGTEPAAIYANAYAVDIHDPAMKEMLDSAVLYLLDNGFMDEAIARFNKKYPDAVIPVSKNYRDMK